MKGLLKYVVIALIAAAIGAFATSKWLDNRKPKVVIEYDTVIERKIDSVPFKVYDTIKSPPEIVYFDIPDTNPMGESTGDTTRVETKKYTGTETLSNGTINWTVYADKLFATEFTLETQERIITKTITETLPPASALFLGGGLDYNNGLGAAEVGLMYNRRQKWQAGIVINHDLTGLLPQEYRTSIGVRAYIKL